ncbi:MAG: hypothetical protein AB7Q16_04660 [Vicinamibacterales bacterium]
MNERRASTRTAEPSVVKPGVTAETRRRGLSALASAFARGWRQFWVGYWRAPIGC